jgi:hypothetical protein
MDIKIITQQKHFYYGREQNFVAADVRDLLVFSTYLNLPEYLHALSDSRYNFKFNLYNFSIFFAVDCFILCGTFYFYLLLISK